MTVSVTFSIIKAFYSSRHLLSFNKNLHPVTENEHCVCSSSLLPNHIFYTDTAEWTKLPLHAAANHLISGCSAQTPFFCFSSQLSAGENSSEFSGLTCLPLSLARISFFSLWHRGREEQAERQAGRRTQLWWKPQPSCWCSDWLLAVNTHAAAQQKDVNKEMWHKVHLQGVLARREISSRLLQEWISVTWWG